MPGSSPLARGTLSLCRRNCRRTRLIPARAGNTARHAAVLITAPAHPRSRGEHPSLKASLPPCCGSSPLARGTPSLSRNTATFTRLIPARAGNTFLARSCSAIPSAHPRSRGEHSSRVFKAARIVGSSPLARGTLYFCFSPIFFRRLIPARAGNTSLVNLTKTSLSAHPRSRGEHAWVPLRAALVRGSSPLARGTLIYSGGRKFVVRLIPARAGNTAPRPRVENVTPAHPRSRGEHGYGL